MGYGKQSTCGQCISSTAEDVLRIVSGIHLHGGNMKPIFVALSGTLLLAMLLLNPLASAQGSKSPTPNPTEIRQTAQAPTLLAATTVARSGLEPIAVANARRMSELRFIRYPDQQERPFQAAFTQDGSQLIVASGNPYDNKRPAIARLWDVQTGKMISKGDVSSKPLNTLITADNQLVMAYGEGGHLRVYDPISGEAETDLDVGSVHGYNMWFTADGSRMVVQHSDEHTLELWDVKQGTSVSKWAVPNYVSKGLFTPDGSLFVLFGLSQQPPAKAGGLSLATTHSSA
jgi:hypothetical protein